MKNAHSRIHLSFDLWTSLNYNAMLAIIGHWTADDYSLKTVLLSIKEIFGKHSGDIIGHAIFEVIQNFHITRLLGFSTTDNARNNDTALETISTLLRDTYDIDYNVSEHRLRCLGHIINLVVKQLLFNSSTLESDEMEYYGTLQKLHNIVHHVRTTP